MSKKLQLGRQGTQWIFVPSFATGEESLPSRASAPPPHPEQYRSDPHHGSCRPLASFEGDAIRRHHRMSQHQSRQRLVKAVANSWRWTKPTRSTWDEFFGICRNQNILPTGNEKTDKKSHHYVPYSTHCGTLGWNIPDYPTTCSKKVSLFLVAAQARADDFLRIWRWELDETGRPTTIMNGGRSIHEMIDRGDLRSKVASFL